MLNAKKQSSVSHIESLIAQIPSEELTLPGIQGRNSLHCFARQILDSQRRIEFITRLQGTPLSQERKNPLSSLFDPIRAAVLHNQEGNVNEAFWLAFLSVNFGCPKKPRWLLAREVYGGLGGTTNTWAKVRENPGEFYNWLVDNAETLSNLSKHKLFSNHRKYESLNPRSEKFNGNSLISYINFIGGDHREKFSQLTNELEGSPKENFLKIYSALKVNRFGRMAKFDYLTMLSKLGLLDIQPDKVYYTEATGPKKGAKLLFYGSINASASNKDLENKTALLEEYLELNYLGLQVLEDSICNWQKSPDQYIYFKG